MTRRGGCPLVKGPVAQRDRLVLEVLEARMLLSTYYASTTGSDSADGSAGTPFATPRPFLSIAQPGDTLYIRQGTYIGAAGTGWSRQHTTMAGTPDAPITIAGYPGENVQIDTGEPGCGFTFLYLTRSNAWLNFDNLHFVNFQVAFNMDADPGFQPPHDIQITNSEFSWSGDMLGTNCDGKPIRMFSGTHDITIRNDIFHHVAGPAIVGVGNISNILIEDCVIHDNNDHRGTAGDADGITFTNAGVLYPHDLTLHNVTVYNTSEDGVDIKADNVVEQNVQVWNVGSVCFKAWSPPNIVQGHFTFDHCLAYNAGVVVFKAFYHPDITLTNSVFVASDNSPWMTTANSEQTVLYKGYTSGNDAGPWPGRFYSRNNIFMNLNRNTGLGSALTLYSDNVVLDMDYDNIYSQNMPAYGSWIQTDGTEHDYSNAQIAAGALWTGEQIEQHATSQLIAVPPAVAPLAPQYLIPLGQPVQLEGAAGDPFVQMLNYTWDFGDGQQAAGEDVSHQYAYVGKYTVTLTVDDGMGHQITTSQQIQYGQVSAVNSAPIVADLSLITLHDKPVNGAAKATDVDGDPLIFALAQDPAHGAVSFAGDGTFVYTPAAGYVGNDSFTFTAYDGRGGADTATVLLVVKNCVPLPVSRRFYSNEDMVFSGSLFACDGDGDKVIFNLVATPLHGSVVVNPDGTFTYTPNRDWFGTDYFRFTASDPYSTSAPAYAWIVVGPVNQPPVVQDLAVSGVQDSTVAANAIGSDVDSPAITFALAAQASHGSAGISTDGSFTYTPNPGWFGTDSFTYTASDGSAVSTPATVTLTIKSAGPGVQALDDQVLVNEDSLVNIPVLNNDIVPTEDSLSILSVTAPAHGSTIVAGDGSITYVPCANWSGTDSFTYTARDSQGDLTSATANIIVKPVNHAPVAQDDRFFVVAAQGVSAPVLANDIDVDGDPLTIASFQQPTHGSVTIGNNNTLLYRADPYYVGLVPVRYTISDGRGGLSTATATFSIVMDSGLPLAVNDTVTAAAGVPLSIDPLANDFSPSGSPLSLASFTQPSHGTLTNAGNGILTYTAGDQYCGTDTFAYFVSNANGRISTGIVSINVAKTGWTTADIGQPAIPGAAVSYGNNYVVTSSGGEIGGSQDELSYQYVTMQGDAQIIAKVSILSAADSLAQAGLMIRDSLDPSAAQATVAVTSCGTTGMYYRGTDGGSTASTPGAAGLTGPVWLKLARSGNTFTSYVSSDGITWSKIGAAVINMSQMVMVGLAVSGHATDSSALALFSTPNIN